MEDQMCQEREATSKANDHQLQTLISELHSLKESNRIKTQPIEKSGKKALLDNIKARIDPILKSDFKGGEHIGIGTRLKGLQEEVTN